MVTPLNVYLKPSVQYSTYKRNLQIVLKKSPGTILYLVSNSNSERRQELDTRHFR